MTELPKTYVPGWSDQESIQRLTYRQLGQTNMFVCPIGLGAAYVGNNVQVKLTELPNGALGKYHPSNYSMSGADKAIEAIGEAIRLGINYLDTSPYYGKGLSEMVIGKALVNVPREAYYIATKAGRKPDLTFDYSAEGIRRSVEESLQKFGVDYIDLLQIHDVEFANMDTILNETLPELDRLRTDKKIRYIGITGYPLSTLKETIEQSSIRIDTVLSYCRFALFDQELNKYLPFFESRKLGIINAAILGMGLFSKLPDWHSASQELYQTCQKAAKLCQEQNISIARLAWQHATSETRIHTHIIGIETSQLVRLNLDTISDQATEPERKTLKHILEEIFGKQQPKLVTNWENVELERYSRDPDKFFKFLHSGGKSEFR